MPVATPSERMKRDLAISSRRQPCTKPRIIRSKKRIDPIEIAKEPPRPTRRLINKQIGDLARINRMPALNDTPPHHQPRQVQPRHQLNGSPRIPPRNRDERRHQAHQIPQRPRKNNQHQPNRTRTLLNAHHRDNSLSPRPLFLRVIQTLCHSERSEESGSSLCAAHSIPSPAGRGLKVRDLTQCAPRARFRILPLYLCPPPVISVSSRPKRRDAGSISIFLVRFVR